MKQAQKFIWPFVGLAAVCVSGWFLYKELQGLSLQNIGDSLRAIPPHRYLLAIMSTLAAYAALAWYDRIALMHLGITHIRWMFVSICSFTTYALSHNIGASVFSGAVVRYRAYTAKGLSVAQVGVLVALCSFTFALGSIFLGGVVLTFDPDLLSRLQFGSDTGIRLPSFLADPSVARIVGICLLTFVGLYVCGSLLHMRPLRFKRFLLEYPRPPVMMRQLVAGPLELLGAAGIIYFALPEAGNPGFMTILAVFLASFSIALVSNAPGGAGVFEYIFLVAMPEFEKSQVIAALIIFRLFYLLIPFALSIFVVVFYERSRLAGALKDSKTVPAKPSSEA